MSKWLDTRGMTSIAIAICDRCKMKRPLAVMQPDPNFPGLRVCDQGCADRRDPYRLPARQTERINLRFPRPDESVAATDNSIINQDGALISTQSSGSLPNGNEDIIVSK